MSDPCIVTAGLSGDMSGWLRQRLAGVGVRDAATAEAALDAIDQGDCSLLIINHALSGIAAMDVLSRVRANPELAALPVIYLLDRHLDSPTGRQLLTQLGVNQLMLHPVDREQVAYQATKVLGWTPAPADTVREPAHPSAPTQATAVAGAEPASPDTTEAHLLVDSYASLLLVDDDPSVAERLRTEAVTRGMRVEVVPNPKAAREAIARTVPDVVLLDLSFFTTAEDELGLLKELNQRVPPIPVLVLTASDTFFDRVQVASLGGRGFLPKNLPPSEVLDAVNRLVQQLHTGESRVMAVDDDPKVLADLRALLDPAGIQLTLLDDPLRFWDMLEQSSPDLLVLDVNMPRLSGIELCRVVRNDARWTALPILLLTDDSDAETVHQVFTAGADDFVRKPIVGPELTTKVINRLERTLLYRSMAEIDPMTGVANRRKSTQSLRQFLRLAERHGQSLSLALLDVDFFKQINDKYGHGTGDSVLQQLGKILLRTFRSEDVVARWGGEEFLIGMYGMNRVDGVQRLTDLLEQIRHESLSGPRGERIRLTFSAGVAQFPEDGSDVQTLYRAADAALYRAKESGRDRVMPVGWEADLKDQHRQAVDIVLAEDDEVLGGMIVHALETRGYRTQWLRDGESAALMLGGLEPTLRAPVILLSTDLPELDGLSVLRRLNRDGILRRTRIIMLADRLQEADVSRALELGAFDHVSKPFSLAVLMLRLRRAMEIL